MKTFYPSDVQATLLVASYCLQTDKPDTPIDDDTPSYHTEADHPAAD